MENKTAHHTNINFIKDNLQQKEFSFNFFFVISDCELYKVKKSIMLI